MKKMKKIVTGALALVLITGAAQAQKIEGKKVERKQPMEQLDLTADQKAKLKAIREAHQKEWKELQKQDNITVKEWKARQQELVKKQRTEMSQVLTKEQQDKLAKMRPQGKGMQAGKGMKRGDFRQKGQPMAQLNLTEDQKTKMKDLNQSFKTKREALKNNTSLAEAQKKEQMQALAQQHRKEVKAVLTAEQQQKLDAMRGERRGKNGK